jgi:predicted DNA-binding transcriptional regulator YafY
MANFFLSSGKAVQRDIEDLRTYCENLNCEGKSTYCGEIIYSRSQGGYYMKKADRQWLNNQDVLGIARILLESRSLVQTEMNSLLCKLVAQSNPESRAIIEHIIRNEVFHYHSVGHNTLLLQRIWDLGQAVDQKRLIKLTYRREYKKGVIHRVIEPRSLLFSEYYFYLIAYIQGEDYNFPAIYRLDRILAYKVQEETSSKREATRFEEGKFRQRVQFMTPGVLMNIRFRYFGPSIEAVLDRLPTATVVKDKADGITVKAEVFGRGIIMWLLSQGRYVEVLAPDTLRQEMYETLKETFLLYD